MTASVGNHALSRRALRGVEVGRVPDRWPLYGVALREIGRSAAGWLRQRGHGLRIGTATPTRLLFAPQDLRTSDATVAQDIYAGYFVFAGRAVQMGGQSPFSVRPPSLAWSEGLHGFGWLRHLRAADTSLARENARALVAEAIGPRRGRHAPGSRSARVVSRRLISFLCQSPMVLTGADHTFYRRFMRAIGMAVRDLERALVRAPRPIDRLSAAIALCYAGLCCGGLESRLRRATRALTVELDGQILADGGHISRNPAILIELLLDLLPLRQVFGSRGVEPPEALDRAIDRMLPMLRLFRHADGELALFNGMGRAAMGHLATLFSYDPVLGEPAQHATYSGYDRLEAGPTIIIADVGPAPPLRASAEAHAGCLSFEMSSGRDRLIINCGAPALEGPLHQAARATAAHCTLTLAEASSCRFLAAEPAAETGWVSAWLGRRLGLVVLGGPRDVEVERRTGPDGSIHLRGRHDGYVAAFGLSHERRLQLAADGTRLDGEDRLIAAEGRDSAGTPEALVRFHLHPTVSASLEPDDGTVLLRTRAGDAWRFSLVDPADGDAGPVRGRRLSVEDGVFFADADGRKATRQIVVAPGLSTAGTPAPLAWRVERVSTAPDNTAA